MITLNSVQYEPIPKKGDRCWFYSDDCVDIKHEYDATIEEVISFWDCGSETVPIYNEDLQDVVDEPIIDLWMTDQDNTFWILAEETDYIIKIKIPNLTGRHVYIARTIDGGWHSFETISPKEFGILDVTGELYKKVHSK